ncbi:hypothetical protein [Streptomyces ziwulingensis]|uniref:Uncharacterized protein n=1 Tax=Streptomyces ziwulingensis TaxID=1045501 RepID=A0ABP9BP70_9ACTN
MGIGDVTRDDVLRTPAAYDDLGGESFEGSRAEMPVAEMPVARRLLVSPAFGSAESRRHWRDTLDQLVPFTGYEYAAKLTGDQLDRLTELHPDGQARFWGATSAHDGKMAVVSTGDVVLFTGRNHVRAIGEVGAIFRNSSFADVMWPPGQGGESWHTVYSLREFVTTEIPYTTLSALLGYQPNFQYPGQLVLSGDRARAGIDGLLITTRTALEEAGAVTPPHRARELPVERQHTRSTTVERAAQRLLHNRDESALVIEFCATLTDTKSTRLSSPAGICDIFLNGPEGRELIEAKSRVERGHVREALAQLLDYARYVPGRVDRLSALFPHPVQPKERDLLHHYGIDVIHRAAPDIFARSPAPDDARERMRPLWERRRPSH